MKRQAMWWLVAAAGGVVSGLCAARGLAFLGWANILVWAVATVGLGVVDGTMRSKAIRLGTYGFTTGFAFMCFGYDGSASLASRFAPFAVIGVFSALCAIAAGATVHLVRHRGAGR